MFNPALTLHQPQDRFCPGLNSTRLKSRVEIFQPGWKSPRGRDQLGLPQTSVKQCGIEHRVENLKTQPEADLGSYGLGKPRLRGSCVKRQCTRYVSLYRLCTEKKSTRISLKISTKTTGLIIKFCKAPSETTNQSLHVHVCRLISES